MLRTEAVIVMTMLVLIAACARDAPNKTATSTAMTMATEIPKGAQTPAVVLSNSETRTPYAIYVSEHAGTVDLWKRADGTCYVRIRVPGWEVITVDATGPVCDGVKFESPSVRP